MDRDVHKDFYPSLHYPELYLLEGGYKAFYETNRDLCKPCAYKPMAHQDHMADLKHFRSKSRSTQGDIGATVARTTARASLKL